LGLEESTDDESGSNNSKKYYRDPLRKVGEFTEYTLEINKTKKSKRVIRLAQGTRSGKLRDSIRDLLGYCQFLIHLSNLMTSFLENFNVI
jgi:hypothetical protein